MNRPSFSGSTEECLRHYSEHFLPPKNAKTAAIAKQPMADFVGVQTSAITSWLGGRNKPHGGSLINVQFFLEAVGYEVVELKDLRAVKPVSYMLAEMLAYGVFTMDEAVQQLEFTDSHSIYRLAHGSVNTSSGREDKIRGIYDIRKAALGEAREKLLKKLGGFSQVVEALTAVHAGAKPKRQDPGDDESITILAHFVLAVTPLLEKAVTDTSKEQRNKLRQLTGDDGMFRLSKASSRLCSEKAREVINHGN